VVQKYGGSSVADVDSIRTVAARVVKTRQSGVDVVVVVSAMGNTTNELLRLAAEVSAEPGRRELDLLISVGERVSMTLLAIAVEELGQPAASFTGSQAGILTDGHHVAASVIEVRPHRVRRALDEGKVAIVAGFQGCSMNGEVTTLGRGGSDTTAVVLTAALGAVHCENCSDVDGVYTADPRVVPQARLIPSLPLDAAVALAHAGSKVLLAEALEQAQRLGVTLVAGATNQAPGSGTRLPPGPIPSEVIAVAVDDGLQALQINEGFLPERFAGTVRSWRPFEGGTRVLVDGRNLPEPGTWALPPGVIRQGPVATVTAVGARAHTDPSVVAAAVRALGVERWWAGAGRFVAEVPVAAVDAAQQSLHGALISR
jgi:aspartate kinase